MPPPRAASTPISRAFIPYPVSIRQPMDVSVRVNGPVNALGGTITVDHPNGVIVIRDPPVQIADLHYEADIRNGVVDVHEGQARVNEGMIYLGGGWNPAVKQGLVAELDDVLFLLGDGILTKWDGDVAVEPAADGTALVIGELVLDQGLWDSPFDLAGAFLGGDQEVADADDITHAIALDLDVRGRGGIHVNNNLGTFDLRWSLLEVWGTLAEPHIGGDINILPGGVLRVAGPSIPLRRGLVQFTGDPLVDPLLDIVPERDVMSSREGTGSPGPHRRRSDGAVGWPRRRARPREYDLPAARRRHRDRHGYQYRVLDRPTAHPQHRALSHHRPAQQPEPHDVAPLWRSRRCRVSRFRP